MMKYQPYHGYGRHPEHWYPLSQPNTCPRRIRTAGDYRYNHPMTDWLDGKPTRYWQRPSRSGGAVYEKQRAHRMFRRTARAAIQRELAGDEVSHAFRYCGNWLD